MPEIGVPELLIVAFIVILLFGPSKAADLGGSLGKSIREFRRASSADADDSTPLSHPSQSASSQSQLSTTDPSLPAAPARFCTECGNQSQDGQRFCTNCGATVAASAWGT